MTEIRKGVISIRQSDGGEFQQVGKIDSFGTFSPGETVKVVNVDKVTIDWVEWWKLQAELS